MADMSNKLGTTLESLRGDISLREASKLSGLSHTYIRDLEKGINRKTKAPIKPSIDVLQVLAQAYGYSLEYILEQSGYIELPSSYLNNLEQDIFEIITFLGDNNPNRFVEKWNELSSYDKEIIKRHFKAVYGLSNEQKKND